MNEMLGNQYFLSKRFNEATTQFERALLFNPQNYGVKKKLIVCYIQQKEFRLALKIFSDLISENVGAILNYDSDNVDCSCRDVIKEIENSSSKLNDTERETMLGILWMYCDKVKSQKYFDSLSKREPQNLLYKKVTKIINQSFLNK